MAEFSYLTVNAESSGIYKEKGSKFISFAFPVNAESEAKDRLKALRKTYYDASHHCFAWIIGADKSQQRASDDGEPGHSAGDPILGQIKCRNLTNVMVVVVRYFGGTKLGVGGLIAAYRAAAHDALTNAVIVEMDIKKSIVFQFDYTQMSTVMRLVKEFDLKITNKEFDVSCFLTCELKLRHEILLLKRINQMKEETSLNLKIDIPD